MKILLEDILRMLSLVWAFEGHDRRRRGVVFVKHVHPHYGMATIIGEPCLDHVLWRGMGQAREVQLGAVLHSSEPKRLQKTNHDSTSQTMNTSLSLKIIHLSLCIYISLFLSPEHSK